MPDSMRKIFVDSLVDMKLGPDHPIRRTAYVIGCVLYLAFQAGFFLTTKSKPTQLAFLLVTDALVSALGGDMLLLYRKRVNFLGINGWHLFIVFLVLQADFWIAQIVGDRILAMTGLTSSWGLAVGVCLYFCSVDYGRRAWKLILSLRRPRISH